MVLCLDINLARRRIFSVGIGVTLEREPPSQRSFSILGCLQVDVTEEIVAVRAVVVYGDINKRIGVDDVAENMLAKVLLQ